MNFLPACVCCGYGEGRGGGGVDEREGCNREKPRTDLSQLVSGWFVLIKFG